MIGRKEIFAKGIARSNADAAETLKSREGSEPMERTEEARRLQELPGLLLIERNGGRFVLGIFCSLLGLDGLQNLIPMNGDFLGGFNPQSDTVSTNLDHSDDDRIAHDNLFVLFSGQYQHDSHLSH